MTMKIKKTTLRTFALVAAVLLVGCSQEGGYSTPDKTQATADKPAASTDLKITQWGPQDTKTGVAFNAQPDGKAALWVQVNQSLDGSDSVVTMDGAALTSAISGNLITADVPATFYAIAGVHQVRVVMTKGALKIHSDDVRFAVE